MDRGAARVKLVSDASGKDKTSDRTIKINYERRFQISGSGAHLQQSYHPLVNLLKNKSSLTRDFPAVRAWGLAPKGDLKLDLGRDVKEDSDLFLELLHALWTRPDFDPVYLIA